MRASQGKNGMVREACEHVCETNKIKQNKQKKFQYIHSEREGEGEGRGREDR